MPSRREHEGPGQPLDAAFEAAVARGWALARSDQEDAAIAHLGVLVERDPDQPRAHVEDAGALDDAGREAEAVAPSRQAFALGLSGDDLPRLYGSTLRNVGEVTEAVRWLSDGRERFPDDAAMRTFRALALERAGRCREAAVALRALVVAGADGITLRGDDRAMRSYSDEVAGRLGP